MNPLSKSHWLLTNSTYLLLDYIRNYYFITSYFQHLLMGAQVIKILFLTPVSGRFNFHPSLSLLVCNEVLKKITTSNPLQVWRPHKTISPHVLCLKLGLGIIFSFNVKFICIFTKKKSAFFRAIDLSWHFETIHFYSLSGFCLEGRSIRLSGGN